MGCIFGGMSSCTVTDSPHCSHSNELVIPLDKQELAAQMYERIYLKSAETKVNPNREAKEAVLAIYGVPRSKVEKR